MVLHGPKNYVDQVNFEEINAELIQKLTIKTKGSSGPSKLVSDDWRRMIGTKLFGSERTDLADAIANMTKELCTELIHDPESIDDMPFNPTR